MKGDYLPAIHKDRVIHHNITLHPPLHFPSLLHSSPGIPLQSQEGAAGAPQLWLEAWQALMLSLSLKVWLCKRQPSRLVWGQRTISALAERVRTGRQGEWCTRKLPPRDAFYPPTSCLHRRMDDALRGRVALVFFSSCVYVCENPSNQLWGPGVGADTWTPQGMMVLS